MFLVNSTDEKTLGQVEYINEKILNIAIELNHRLREFTPGDKVVAVTTFVDLDSLDTSSSFGRYVSERLSMELHKLGFNIRELRQRKSISVEYEKGEFALTRNTEDLMRRAQVDAVLTGTYTVIGDEVIVNARFLDLDSSRVISVGHMVADFGSLKRIRNLLSRRHKGSTPVVKVVSPESG
jgi:TolB-like protein